jgi:hypothetical protein
MKKPKKKRKKPPSDKVGRPTKRDDRIVRKLADAFRMDYNVTQACIYTGIARDTYYAWLEEDKEFSYKMADAQQYATMLAKNGHIRQLQEGDGQAIRFQLSKRAIDPETGKKEYKDERALDATVKLDPPDLDAQAILAAQPFLDLDDATST